MRIAIVIVFGLVPSLPITYYALFGFAASPGLLLSERYFLGLVVLSSSLMICLGTLSLVRYLFGTPVYQLRPGMTAGLVALIMIVINPYVRLLLVKFGVESARFSEGINLGAAVLSSMYCIIPMAVYGFLTYQSWRHGPLVTEAEIKLA